LPNETKLKAFDLVKEWATQLITVASATLVLSATFYKDIFSASGVAKHPNYLGASWFLFLLSIVLGIGVLGALSYHLNEVKSACHLASKRE